jgi:predicted RNase H-like HicB family nuclease
MELSYTYWEAEEGGYIGFINQYPNYWTQGETLEELEMMLKSLYKDLLEFGDIQSAVPQKTGNLVVA